MLLLEAALLEMVNSPSPPAHPPSHCVWQRRAMRPPAAAAPPYRCSPGVGTEHSIVKPQNWATINYWLLLLGEYFPYHQEGSDIHVPTKLQVSSTVMTQETELHINIHQLGRLAVEVETWVVAIFTLPITLPHPGHAIVGCSILVLTSARDMTRTRGWGPGCCRRLGWAGLGWAGLEAAVPVAQPAPAQPNTATIHSSLPELHSPSLANNYPYTLHTVDTL